MLENMYTKSLTVSPADYYMGKDSINKLKDIVSSNISNSVISHDWASHGDISFKFNYEDIFEEMKKRFNVKPIIHHNCHNCGGRLELKEDQHIFNCPYCGSVYAVGISQINS